MIIVNPDGTLHRHQKVGDALVELEPVQNPDYVAPVDPLETVAHSIAYWIQSLREIGNPPEMVFEQGDELSQAAGRIHVPAGLTDEQARRLFYDDVEQKRLKLVDTGSFMLFSYEQAWGNRWKEDPEIWADYDAIASLAPFISEVAQRWNFPESGMSDYEVAVLLVANLHQESVLRRDNPAENDFHNQLGVIKDILGDAIFSFLGQDSSLGPANLRPSVVDEILGKPGSAPLTPTPKGSISFNDEGRLDALAQEWQSFGDSHRKRIAFLYNPENAIELMGANFRRGIERSKDGELQPTMFNMSAWLSQGIAESHTLRTAQDNIAVAKAIDHARDTVRFVNAIIANRDIFGIFSDSDEFIDWDDFVLFNDDDLLAYLRD